MPGFMTHYILGIKMYQDIPDTLLKESIHRHKNLFRLGLQGPDFLFAYPRTVIGKKGNHIGSRLHKEKVNLFFENMLTMACEERERENKEMAVSYISGFLCHYILDSTMHPYIYDVAGYDPYAPNSNEVNGAHTQLENLLDTWLIQYYKGKKSLKVRKAAIVVQLTLRETNFLVRFFSASVNGAYYKGSQSKYATTETFIRHALTFYRITCDLFHDTTGRKRRVMEGVERHTWKYPFVSPLIYPGKDPDIEAIMNLNHWRWSNPWDRSRVSSESFLDLYQKAQAEGTKIFASLNAYLEPFYAGEDVADRKGQLLAVIGNRSYHSGLDCLETERRLAAGTKWQTPCAPHREASWETVKHRRQEQGMAAGKEKGL